MSIPAKISLVWFLSTFSKWTWERFSFNIGLHSTTKPVRSVETKCVHWTRNDWLSKGTAVTSCIVVWSTDKDRNTFFQTLNKTFFFLSKSVPKLHQTLALEFSYLEVGKCELLSEGIFQLYSQQSDRLSSLSKIAGKCSTSNLLSTEFPVVVYETLR